MKYAAIAVLATISSLAQAESSAVGAISLKGQSFEVADAVAYPDSRGLEIAMSSGPLNKEAMRADGKVDSLDLLMNHKGLFVFLRLEDGKPSHCLSHSYRLDGGRNLSGSVCVDGLIESVEISALSADRVAGTVDWKGEDGASVKASFDLPIEADGS